MSTPEEWWRQASELQRLQVAAGINWLRAKWGEEARACPYCDNEAWTVGTPVYLDVGFGLAEPGFSTMSPLFPVMCTNCGNTVFISAVIAGVVSDQVEESALVEEPEEPSWKLP